MPQFRLRPVSRAGTVPLPMTHAEVLPDIPHLCEGATLPVGWLRDVVVGGACPQLPLDC